MSFNGDTHIREKEADKEPTYLDLYFDIAGVILMAMNPEGRITALNRKGCDILGYDHESIIGTSWFDYIPARHKESVKESFEKLMSGEIKLVEASDRPILTATGEECFIRWHTNPLKNEQGEIIGLISSGEDITERKRAELNLETRSYELGERVKELVCLYETARLLSSGLPLDEIFQNLTYLMQNAWQYSDLTCVRVRHMDKIYQTENFRETGWNQHSTIHLNDIEIGSLDVFYLEELSEEAEGPFLKEERDLIDALAENVTIFLERLASEKKLQWELSFNKAMAELANVLISSDPSIVDISAKVLEYSKLLTKSEHGYASSLDPITHDVIGHTLSEMMGDQCKLSGEKSKITFPINEDGTYDGLWGFSLNNRKAFYTNNPQSHATSKGLPSGHLPLHSFLSVPAIISDELVGQIALANSESGYTEADLDTITRLGSLFAIAISRKRIETTLQESEERYRTLVQSMNDLVFVFDSDDRYAQYYASDESNLILSPDSLLGKNISEVLPESVAEMFASIFQQVRDNGESTTFDYPLQINGRDLWFSAANSLHEDGMSIVSVIRDITTQKELEHQREQHRKELELYSSLLHHDIGNDLHVILGYLEIAEMEYDSPEANTLEMLGPVRNATERMQSLLATLGSPREEIQTEMLQLVSKVASKAQQVHKGLSIQISVARGVQPLRVVSSRLLPMVFENLFRNSVQFSKIDPIIDVEMSKSEGKVIVDVSDNGPGIPDEIQSSLFQRGVSTTGSGIGLYLVKQILTAYDGTIELIGSKSGTGANFRITIPLAK